MAWVSWDAMAKPKAIGGLGFRDFQIFNTALLAKTSWRLLQHPGCLLSRVLMGKYCPDSNILLVEGTTSMSHGWRSVLLGRDLLAQNLGWVVGDGRSIQAWNDPWLSFAHQERPMGPPNEHQFHLKVSDLLIPGTGEWDVPKLQSCLPDYSEKIQAIRSSKTGAPDKLIWLGTKTGDYSTKSGYFSEVARDDNNQQRPNGRDFNWRKNIWSLECAPKIKTFAWKLLKGALPVGERLTDRHIPIDPRCKRCGAFESITHLFFQCQYSRKVWRLAPFMTVVETSGALDLVDSWPSLVSNQCLPPVGITSKSLAVWILWSIWKARNRFVFEGFSVSPEDTLTTAIELAREWEEKLHKEAPRKAKRPPPPYQPPSASTVIRSDGAWTPTGSTAGLGWAIFSTTGIRSDHKRVSFVSSALMAEGLALLEAVRSGRREEMKTVAFEADSSQLINCLNRGTCIPELYGAIEDILALVLFFDFVSFSWICRESNSLADSLAKSAMLVSVNSVVEEAFMASN